MAFENKSSEEAGVAKTSSKEDQPCRLGEAKARAFHPFLIASFPVIAIYANNSDEARLIDIPVPLLAVLCLALAGVFSARVAFATKERAALAASYVLALWFFYKHLLYMVNITLVPLGLPLGRHRYVMIIWGLLVLAGLVWLRLARFDDVRATKLLNTISTMLILVLLPPIGISLAKEYSATLPGIAEQTQDLEEEIVLQRPKPCRDIYYLVFDRYADNQTLENHFDFDNGQFTDQLQDRGFFLAEQSLANYPKTAESLISTLNMKYLRGHLSDKDVVNALPRGHAIGRLLKSKGYRYYHFGNWYTPFRNSRIADFNYRVSPFPSEFAEAIYGLTPLVRLYMLKRSPEQVLKKFEDLKKVAPEPGPKFVYAHFLLPHPPFVFDRDGSTIPWFKASLRSDAENYVNQLIFSNGKILDLVDSILDNSETEPIIVIQSDEGPYLRQADINADLPTQIRKRTGIISAFHLPGVDMAETIPQTISPINTFRLLLREYFDADIDLLEDRVFYFQPNTPDGDGGGNARPYYFTDVTTMIREDQP